MSKVTLEELGLGADDLAAIGKLSESGMTPDQIADAVEKAHELVGQDLVTQAELDAAIEGIDALTPEQTATLDKLDGLGSSASEIDNAVANHITQAELDAAVLGSGNITPEQAATISSLSGMSSTIAEIDTATKAKNSFNAINNTSFINDGTTTFDSYTKKHTIPLGTTSVPTKTTTVSFNNVLGELNNALLKGVADFKISFSCASTKDYNIIYTIQSNRQNTTLGISSIPSNEIRTFSLPLVSGEVVTSLTMSARYADNTATEELFIKWNSSYLYSSNSNVNYRFQMATINEPVDDNLFQNSILINRNQYQVSHTTTNNTVTGLVQTYRGFKILNGSVIPVNKAYIGRYLTSNFSYLNGKTFTTKIIVKITGTTASTLFSGIWISLGDDLYYKTDVITSFDAGNSSKIFSYTWNKAITATSDITVTLVDMYIIGTGNDIFSLIEKYQRKTEKDPIKIYCNATSQGTYGEEYINLLTAMHSLVDGSENNIYDVIVDGGTYDLTTMLDYTNIQDSTSYKRGLELSPYVNLYGKYNTIINCKFTEAFASSNQTIAQAVSTLNFLGHNKLKNIKAFAENCRYVVHDDGNSITDGIIETENCHFEHLGNSALVSWTSTTAYGSGFPSGKIGMFKNTSFISATDALSIHTSNLAKKPFVAKFYGCNLISKKDNGASINMIQTSAHSPKMINTFELNGCTLGGVIKGENTTNTDCFNLVGSGNTIVPVLTTNGVKQINSFGDQCSNMVASEGITYMKPLVMSSLNKVRQFIASDSINSLIGFAQKTVSINSIVPVLTKGYILGSDIGMTLVVGDTVALDSGVLVKNGTNTIGKCTFDGYVLVKI